MDSEATWRLVHTFLIIDNFHEKACGRDVQVPLEAGFAAPPVLHRACVPTPIDLTFE